MLARRFRLAESRRAVARELRDVDGALRGLVEKEAARGAGGVPRERATGRTLPRAGYANQSKKGWRECIVVAAETAIASGISPEQAVGNFARMVTLAAKVAKGGTQ